MIQLVIELSFFVDMLICFLTEYTDKQKFVIRDVSKTSVRYFKNEFIYDFVPLIPCNTIFTFRYSRFLYFIKVFRLKNTFNAIKHEVLMKHIKAFF